VKIQTAVSQDASSPFVISMSSGRHTAIRPKVNVGSVEITEDRAIYTDSSGVRWRLYDFALVRSDKREPVHVGAITATMRIFVREGGRERRRILFAMRDDTLSPSFNYHHLSTAAVLRRGKWISAELAELDDDEVDRMDMNHPYSKPRYH
jgi:hypothetical protein